MAPICCRRTFLRSGLALVLAAYSAACRAPAEAVQRPTAPATGSPAHGFATAPAPTAYLPLTTVAPAAAPQQFSGALAYAHVAAQMQWLPRDTGTPGWQQCGDYIAAQFAAQGWAVENQHFAYKDIRCRNVIAKRGSGPGLIIGAHYDARRRADQDKDPARRNDPVPAANDGASGIGVLLELARVIAPEALGREIWLAAFDAEDNGDLDGWEWIVGSRAMAASLAIQPEAVVVIDMIGDADQNIYFEGNSDLSIRENVWQVARELQYPSFVPQIRYSMLDDHTAFLDKGYRAIDIIDFDYPHWHTTEDTLDKVSAASLEAVGRTLEEWLRRGAPGSAPQLAVTAAPYPPTAPTTDPYPAQPAP